ncbi:MAG: cytochrome c3 family protein [Gemmatimonadaceae bacterium]
MSHLVRNLRSTLTRIPSVPSLAAAVIVLAAAGCSGDNVVFRDRAPFNPPPDAASGFLGYYDADTKQTTCGNCHSGFQASWVTTAHASAHATLEASSAKQDFCYSCHTVTGKGNVVGGTTAGYDKVKVDTYNDVQCESCHGPGLQHVEGVSQGTLVRPLAKLSMTGSGNCGDCHSGVHQPFAEEWKESRHAFVDPSRASRESCLGCHDGRGALARFGEDGNYVEKDVATAYQPTTCAVCHDPHGSANTKQLRFSISAADPELNLCMRCHLRVAVPELTGYAATRPHAPQGAMLLGFAGWRPPGFQYDTARIFGSHATTKNPRLCAGCHVNSFTVTDKATGAFAFQSTGHLMRPVPCLDATGKPTADKTCAYTSTARTWQSCTASGCHGSAEVAANIFNDSRALMKSFTDQLWADLDHSHYLEATPRDAGMLATLKATRPGEWSNTDNMTTPAEGAEFNARLCGEYDQSNSDNSKGVHNPFLCRALLIATINYVRSYYSLPGPSLAEQRSLNRINDPEFLQAVQLSRRTPGR